ncbi:hypothetical protein AB4238_22010 [Shewanella sp. 10N.286.45.A1]|uniref:hypothetical protein n=1 Tax=Shewanella sp. 10N.286.45.A1 TaxID=3229694 RepID=UPI00354B9B5F
MVTRVSSCIAFTYIFIALLFPYFKLGGVVIPSLVFSYIFPVLYFFKKINFDSEDRYLFLLCLIGAVIAIFVGFISDSKFSLRIVFVYLFAPFIFLSAKIFVVFCIKKNISSTNIYSIVVNVIFVNSLFVLLLNLNVINADLFYSVIHTNPLVFDYPITRYPGFAYDAFSYLSVLNAFGLCLLLQLHLSSKLDISVSFIIKFVIIMAAMIFTGRAGILVIVLFTLYQSINFVYKKPRLVLALLTMTSLSLFISWGEYDWLKDWAFGFIFNFINGNKVVDSSVTGVMSMIFIPDNVIIGDEINFLSVQSDLGFVRVFSSLGFLGLFHMFTFFLLIFFSAIKYNNTFLLFLVLTIFMLNFKDIYLVSPYGHTFLMFLVLYVGKLMDRNNVVSVKLNNKGDYA